MVELDNLAFRITTALAPRNAATTDAKFLEKHKGMVAAQTIHPAQELDNTATQTEIVTTTRNVVLVFMAPSTHASTLAITDIMEQMYSDPVNSEAT